MSANARDDRTLSAISAWAQRTSEVRALILTGSRAREEGDDLSDFDLEVFARDSEVYVRSDTWISQIRPVWVHFALHDEDGYPTRLVIFEGGAKVDFSIYPVSVLEEQVASGRLSTLYDLGFRVLVDKDGLAARLQAPTQRPPLAAQPSEREFIDLVREFWFEAYHVAKYLTRKDLWAAKFRDWGLKELLLRMFEWREKALHGWDYDTRHLGVRMREWLEPSIWQRVNRIFAHFDAHDTWRALEETLDLFRSVAQETARKLHYRYPEDVDKHLSGYIDSLGKSRR